MGFPVLQELAAAAVDDLLEHGTREIIRIFGTSLPNQGHRMMGQYIRYGADGGMVRKKRARSDLDALNMLIGSF